MRLQRRTIVSPCSEFGLQPPYQEFETENFIAKLLNFAGLRDGC